MLVLKYRSLGRKSLSFSHNEVTILSELKKLGTDFVYGFIQAMDGEKDPRNLVIAFQSARLVIENFPLGMFSNIINELITVLSHYTPRKLCLWEGILFSRCPNERPTDHPTERVSVTFCFLNNFKNH